MAFSILSGLGTGLAQGGGSHARLMLAERLKRDAEARAMAQQEQLSASKFSQQEYLQQLRDTGAMNRLGVQQEGASERARLTREQNQPRIDASVEASKAKTDLYTRPQQSKPVKLEKVTLDDGTIGLLNPYSGDITPTKFKERVPGTGQGQKEDPALKRMDAQIRREYESLLNNWPQQQKFQFKAMYPDEVWEDQALPPIDDATRAELWNRATSTVMAREGFSGQGPAGNTAGAASGKDFSDVDDELSSFGY